MPKYLITGGAGFIGSHLAERLVAMGQPVKVIDNLSTGSIENIAHLRSSADFEFVLDEVCNERVLGELVDSTDVVFHLAATVGVQKIIESPVATIINNVHGTEAVLKAAAKKRRRVIVVSTSEVYGKSDALPFSEEGDLVLGSTSKCRWSYACSKAIDEFLALAYHKEYKTPATIVRLFNTIGPRQSGQYGMVVPRFVNQALEGNDLTIYGSGKQTRSFTFISDVVTWLILLSQNSASAGEVFNLGNPNEITITDLAERIVRMAESSSGLRYIPYEQAYESGFEDMGRRNPDISKLIAATGFAPQVGVDDALARIISWTRSRRASSERGALRAVSGA